MINPLNFSLLRKDSMLDGGSMSHTIDTRSPTQVMLLDTLTFLFSFIEANSKSLYPPSRCQLPSEVLVHIFSLLSAIDTKFYQWTRVTHVCRFWRESAIRAPDLWSSISTQNPDAALSFIHRSIVSPLSVYIRHFDPNHPSADTLWHTLFGNEYRIRLLDLTCTENHKICPLFTQTYPHIQTFLNHPAPLLDHLSFDLDFYKSKQHIPSHFTGEFPNLKVAQLINFITLGPGNVSGTLRKLVLTRQVDCLLALEGAVDLMEANPLLEDVVLYAERPILGSVVVLRRRVVRLERMERFCMRNYGADSVKSLLSVLELPSNAVVEIVSPVQQVGCGQPE